MRAFALEAPSTRVATARHVAFALTGAMVVHHFALWTWATARHGIGWSELLTNWDSGHYTAIVLNGYDAGLLAWLPLYPGCVALLHRALGEAIAPELLGTALSLLCLLAFVALTARPRTVNPDVETGSALGPRTAWGWFVFLYSPASYTFHSHHGEALFLLLSFLAFELAWRRGWAGGAVAAGFSVLARNQGALVGLATAAITFLRSPREERGRALWGTALIGTAAGATLLGLEYALSGGNALAHLDAQKSWHQVGSLGDFLRTFWWGHPWQRLYLDSAIHHLLWFVLVGVGFAFRGRLRPIGLYIWASALVMPLQAELINVYRYGAVLFPVWFLLGDGLARAPGWVRWPAAAGWVWLNHVVTLNFALGRWAY